ncbi:MAG: hypothetical protein KJ893_03190 [Candidatus Omnitrophica bacterium]|nr:hypothetical protein [Candidatus Omnitrophota bacterium]MBU4478070.1 hypothetical protein [Candidatus Omnitrophota bacterium]MCG2704358.1 hypothetical protein [Candidatus Omnitrophota bacterium]
MKIEEKEGKFVIVDYRKVLAMGIAVENKSIRFYEACKGKVSLEMTKTGLQAVIEQERKHKVFFEEMLKKFIL